MRRLAILPLVVTAMLSSCTRLRPARELSIADSPDSSRRAVAIAVENPGGALGSTTIEVRVGIPGAVDETSRDGLLVWRSADIAPIWMFWLDDSTLEVLVRPSASHRFDTIRSSRGPRFRVVTRVLEGSAKGDLCRSESFEELNTLPL